MSRPAHGIAMEWHDAQPSHTISYLAPTITEWLRESGARRVLDLGCGNGALTIQLAKQGFEMVGVDASESGVRIAASRKNDHAVFRQAWLDAPSRASLSQLLQQQGFCRSRIVCRERIPLFAKSMIAEAHLH